jgi:putative N6-adenine-specific DNA methylase
VNPPYGVRLDEETAAAWRALGALLARLGGWRAVVLAPDRGLERLLPLAPEASLPVSNGGIRCRLLRYHP